MHAFFMGLIYMHYHFLFVLAVFDLIVGVSNGAVNLWVGGRRQGRLVKTILFWRDIFISASLSMA